MNCTVRSDRIGAGILHSKYVPRRMCTTLNLLSVSYTRREENKWQSSMWINCVRWYTSFYRLPTLGAQVHTHRIVYPVSVKRVNLHQREKKNNYYFYLRQFWNSGCMMHTHTHDTCHDITKRQSSFGDALHIIIVDMHTFVRSHFHMYANDNNNNNKWYDE